MKKIISITVFLTLCFSLQAQHKVILQHSKRKGKQKELSQDKYFHFKMQNSAVFGKIMDFDTDTFTILRQDSTTSTIAIADIQIVERFKAQNRRWMEPFAYMALGAGMTLAATPIVWIADGGDKALEALEFAGILTLATVPPILIGTRKERYNLKKKWRIEVE